MKSFPLFPVAIVFLWFTDCQAFWIDTANLSATEQQQSSRVSSALRDEEADAPTSSRVKLLPVPDGGIQPQAINDSAGTVHLIYFKGQSPRAGDLYYVRRQAGQDHFSDPIRVNSRPGTVCAVGSVRGGQIALGKAGRVHIVWNGLGTDYARLNDTGTAFEAGRRRNSCCRFVRQRLRGLAWATQGRARGGKASAMDRFLRRRRGNLLPGGAGLEGSYGRLPLLFDARTGRS
jgi:hypothetical protein